MAAVVLVIGLVVGLFTGARWARAKRARADLRGARAGVIKATQGWKDARNGAVIGLTVTALFLLAIANDVITLSE